MNTAPLSFLFRRLRRAFSLVEVTLALGIVTFALVGVVGVLPVAMSSSRQSFDKNRAAAIAETLFTSFRSQPFQSVAYLDSQFKSDGTPNPSVGGLLDLNALPSVQPTPAPFYATFLDAATPSGDVNDSFGAPRHLCFTSLPSGSGADYLVTMHFSNNSAAYPVSGMVIVPATAAANATPSIPAQGNQVELIISPVSHPKDQYRFMSIIANRTN